MSARLDGSAVERVLYSATLHSAGRKPVSCTRNYERGETGMPGHSVPGGELLELDAADECAAFGRFQLIRGAELYRCFHATFRPTRANPAGWARRRPSHLEQGRWFNLSNVGVTPAEW